MTTEMTIPILSCRRLDDVLPFYETLGFDVTYRQARPNPYAAVQRGGIHLHFGAFEEFDPEASLGNVIVLVPDTGALFTAFAAGLRAAYGKLPIAGIPRITRPRRKQGVDAGFSVVDPGGNWLRISSRSDPGDTGGGGKLDRVLLNATRQGDALGDPARGIAVLETGLARHSDAPAVERVPLLVYLAELRVRSGDAAGVAAVLATIRTLDLGDAARVAVAGDLATAEEIERDALPSTTIGLRGDVGAWHRE